MEVVKKIIINGIIILWSIVAIFVTICLLSYNEYKVTTFGKNALLIIDSDELEPEIHEGDLLIVKRNSDNQINVGDKVFYYNSAMDSKVLVYNDVVLEKQAVTRDETTYVFDSGKVSGEDIIGKASTSKVYHKLGSILQIFTSKWGFMLLVILPTLFAIIYEIMMIFETVHTSKEQSDN
jgi:hypothetical protein